MLINNSARIVLLRQCQQESRQAIDEARVRQVDEQVNEMKSPGVQPAQCVICRKGQENDKPGRVVVPDRDDVPQVMNRRVVDNVSKVVENKWNLK